ncbi:hypothetical protein EUTSA_v10010933mg [Eutrema salsugineum]|uniref:Uncharacterized protein n=1 Tax=Eutrema salsugineum TaxID=72664 RepID=V4LZG8_EUTSA|nr:hypothetical protein EUTSA_v10010933mg [Eutrema salsugineum]
MVSFIKAWGLVIVSLYYAFFVAKLVPKGIRREGPLNNTIKAALFVLPEKAVLTLHAIHTYFALELIPTATATVIQAMSGLELEPQFKRNKLYLATSLQDLWGRRWNLTVTGILRPTVREPTAMWFFLISGLCTTVEITIKKTVPEGGDSRQKSVRF